jgi:hypothetical protein
MAWQSPIGRRFHEEVNGKLHRVGLEPVTLTGSNDKDLRTAENPGGAESGALFRQTVQNHPDLARIVAAWPTLPDAIRRAIVGMIDAAFRED